MGSLLALPASLCAQTTDASAAVAPSATSASPPNPDRGLTINSPPFDFNDNFYTANGINVGALDTSAAGRFGLFRLTGPPAGPGQVNWVVDNSNTDPDRNNVRILATTGGYIDDETSSPTQFISIIAFLLNQNFFTGVANKRGILMQNIVSNFEAYAGLKQILPDGTFAPTPCGTMGTGTKPCFPVTSIATPNLRQDWRFSTNRNRIDGSSPFGYFCDDILGMWIVTYFWYVDTGFGPNQTSTCKAMLNALGTKNGLSLDGTPIIKTGNELNFLEGKKQTTNPIPGFSGSAPPSPACANEANEDVGGADGGAVWLICPAIPDPTQGGIAQDAFADVVHKPNGALLDPDISNNFNCLQKTGQFCPLVSGTYTVTSSLSGLGWADPDSSTKPGTNVQLAALDGNISQQWSFAANGDGTYTITNLASNLVLDDPNSSTTPGTLLVQNTSTGGTSQHWFVTPGTNLSGFTLMNQSSGLLVDGSDNKTGIKIDQGTPNAGANQVWLIGKPLVGSPQ